MAIYDYKQCVLLIGGYEITAFNDAADAINISYASDAGAYTIGSGGNGVFVATGNASGTLTLNLLQHSQDNQVLSQLFNQQVNAMKSFVPLEMYFKDTLNGDEIMGTRGYFTTPPATVRGNAHNPTQWVIAFEKITTQYHKGAHN